MRRVAGTQAPPPAIEMVNEGAEKLCRDPEQQRHCRLPEGHIEKRIDPIPIGSARQGALMMSTSSSTASGCPEMMRLLVG